ncbi:vanadium-dependent haloperoxidase [Actomonas aquatica]|uniref:Vanadium-dependent haloperoxidase n=1 Tax=Actomonas aquatica TaxID=2866162 RepID=A0ABZ1CAR2_9BACT|nr:vanadium-dependent haloperoxidase [Opitutus sp. WL0086]WRQ88766.1 vanadium-dependent haloperoxidase [Opitutus sp. WL0086]
MPRLAPLLAGVACLAATSPHLSYAETNPVLFWNEQALNATRLARNPPPVSALWFGSYHAAIADAVNGIEQRWEPWLVKESAPAGANVDAAIAAAARTMLRQIWGQQANPRLFDVAYTDALAAIPDGPGKDAGLAWGQKVAEAVLTQRSLSGFKVAPKYLPSDAPGKWRPTAPDFRAGVTPQMATTQPFVLQKPNQFRAPPPPPVDSKAYAEELMHVMRVGSRDDADRSEYDTLSVPFWADGLGTAGPSGHWNEITARIARDRGLDTIECARLFALLNFAAADGFITAWDSKYFYNTARPETDARELTAEINPYFKPDPDFIPSMASLPFPAYISAHMTFTSAAVRVLQRYFGTDEVAFSIGSDALPGVVRDYQTLSSVREEVGASRIFGGIHFPMDVDAARIAGIHVGDWVFENSLQPQH